MFELRTDRRANFLETSLLLGRLRRFATATSAAALACCCALVPLSPAAHAETISDALAQAYRSNSKLDAARATLRATDEEVSRANSGYRPTISGTTDVGTQTLTQRALSGNVTQTESHPRGYGVTAIQPLFRGGRVLNTVRTAEAQVRAGREILRSVEQTVLLDSATSYLDVIRDLSISKLREGNVKVLGEELKATRERFAVGEVTRTDVAQSEASLAAARSALDLAKSNLQTSRASFERNVGNAPGQLVPPKGLEKYLPRTLEDAVAISSRENPSVVNALYNEQAARHSIDTIWGELLPSAQLQAGYTRRYDTAGTADTDTKSIVGTLTVPLYSGGEVQARVRQAKQTHISRIQQIEQQRTEVKALVVSGWSALLAARAQLVSDNAQVASAQTALTGVREEERVGQRTLLDVLNAEQVLLNARVAVVTDQRNIAVAAYTVMSAVGRLNIQELGGVEAVYDAEVHYTEVRRQAWGVSVTRADGRDDVKSDWRTHAEPQRTQDDPKGWKPAK
jgi:outer membrane protein